MRTSTSCTGFSRGSRRRSLSRAMPFARPTPRSASGSIRPIPSRSTPACSPGAACSDGSTDIFMCCTDWLAEAIQDEHIICLADHVDTRPAARLANRLGSDRPRLQQDDHGRPRGLPYHDGPEVFMYRTDLFEDPREEAPLRAPARSPARPADDLERVPRSRPLLHRPDDDLYGCVVAGKPDGHNSVYDFAIHLWSRGGGC